MELGRMQAILHGAIVIWDFDDHDMLKFWTPEAGPTGAPSLEATIPSAETVTVQEMQGHMWLTYNPYMYPISGVHHRCHLSLEVCHWMMH